MIKFMPVFTNRDDISRDESRYHYRYRHGRLAASVEGLNRHMPRYVQNFVLDGLPDIHLRPKDPVGVSECWFYSLEGFWQAFAEPSYTQFREDEVRFLDINNLLLVAARETPIFGGSGHAPLKYMRFATFQSSADVHVARKLWEIDHARALSDEQRLRRVVRTYVQNRPVEGFTHNFPVADRCDVAEEFWFDNIDYLAELLAVEADVRIKSGFDAQIDETLTRAFVVESKLLWDLGENPANGLVRLGSAAVSADQQFVSGDAV